MPNIEDAALARLEKVYKDKISFYQEKLKAINILKDGNDESGLIGFANGISKTKDFDKPKEYNVNLSQDAKIYFALSRIKEGFVDDVASELERLDMSFDFVRAKKLATQKLSKLNKEGHINHTKIGIRYKYWI